MLIEGKKINDCCGIDIEYMIADVELYNTIESDYDNGSREAMDIDCDIYYYCDSGFIASNPSEEKIIEYFKENDI